MNTEDLIPILDTGKFEQMLRIAGIMAAWSLAPAHLKAAFDDVMDTDGYTIRQERAATKEETQANCFNIVNLAVRWGLDPFSVALCCSVHDGQLVFEGKLIHAVITAKLGIRLAATYTGSGLGRTVTMSGQFANEPAPRTVTGSVESWQSVGKDSPWGFPPDHDKLLLYKGSREWCRLHAPEVILGVYTAEEFHLADTQRAVRAVPPAPMSSGHTDEGEDSARAVFDRLTASKMPAAKIVDDGPPPHPFEPWHGETQEQWGQRFDAYCRRVEKATGAELVKLESDAEPFIGFYGNVRPKAPELWALKVQARFLELSREHDRKITADTQADKPTRPAKVSRARFADKTADKPATLADAVAKTRRAKPATKTPPDKAARKTKAKPHD